MVVDRMSMYHVKSTTFSQPFRPIFWPCESKDIALPTPETTTRFTVSTSWCFQVILKKKSVKKQKTS